MHHCHATGCQTHTIPLMFMCKKHWFSLTFEMRRDICKHYRPGQCEDWNISKEYASAARVAVRYVAGREGTVADTSVYDMLSPE